MPATCSDLMLGRLKAPSGGFRMRRGEPVTELRGALPMTIAEPLDARSRRTALGMSTLALAACFMRSEEHTSELQSLMRISYAVFCLKKKNQTINTTHKRTPTSQTN